MVKRIQKGTITIGSSTKTATATITSVNTAKSVVLFSGYSNAFRNNMGYPQQDAIRLELTNATTVTASRVNSGGAITIPYQVVEYY